VRSISALFSTRPENKIKRVVELILGSEHTVVLTGAGHSTPSGIPDFRSPESGLWSMADPMAVASIWAFQRNPQAFFDWVRPLAKMLLEAEPNPAHIALADLEQMGLLKTVITQNIDNLHRRAGSKHVLEIHGHLREATCIRCYTVVPAQGMIKQFVEDGQPPRCACGGTLKPNVILFGEMLPVDVMAEAERESRTCDLMIVAGSSLEVAPAGDLPLLAKRHGADLVIINFERTAADRHADVVIHDDVATVLPRIVEGCREALS